MIDPIGCCSQPHLRRAILAIVCVSAVEVARADDKLIGAVRQYCVRCHGPEGDANGEASLGNLSVDRLEDDAELTRKIVDVLESGEMPPEDEPQPPQALRDAMLAELRPILHTSAMRSRSKRTPIRRMNRFQYNNAVVDLFGLNCTVFTLPERTMRVHRNYFDPASGRMPDTVSVGNRALGKSQMIEGRLAGVAAFPQDLRAEHGYDNRGDHLSLSPLLMGEFLRLGDSITQSPDFARRRVGIWEDFFAAPADSADMPDEIRNRLRGFLTRAFRRPVDDELLTRYTRFVTTRLGQGVGFTDAMRSVAAAAIASPRFLYLYDRGGVSSEGKPQSLTELELASRLSFFLWGSIPDEQLLAAARAGTLSEPDTLIEQTNRLLKDKKLKRFCDSFPSQWLQLDRIVSSVPDEQRFPVFYFSKYRLSMHMMLEPLLLFETVLIEDLPITKLIDPDFTYRSPKLERTYGQVDSPPKDRSGAAVGVLNFRRTPVTDRRAGGVITNPAVMTMTSGPEETKPITRGAWMAAVIFNDPPEPPPADVPPLPEKPQPGEENFTLRERLSLHRKRADCRGCHAQIDPLGFALENYDAIGLWRNQYENGRDIDSSGKLFKDAEFSNVVELKDVILADPDRFTRALASHLLSFALARELGPRDRIAVDKITRAVADDDYRMQTLLRQIILSEPFRTKS